MSPYYTDSFDGLDAPNSLTLRSLPDGLSGYKMKPRKASPLANPGQMSEQGRHVQGLENSYLRLNREGL